MRWIYVIVAALATAVTLSACQQTTPSGNGTREAPVFNVTSTGVSPAQAEALAQALGIDAAEWPWGAAGVASYLDPATHLQPPMREVDPRDVPPDEDFDEPREVTEVLDTQEIAEMQAPSEDEAAARFRDALQQAELAPNPKFEPEGAPLIGTSRATIQVRDRTGGEVARGTLHTRAGLAPELDGHPYVGPGATGVASFANVDGETRVTSFRFAWRQLDLGESVDLIPTDEAKDRCLDRLTGSSEFSAEEIEVNEPTLVYYAPSLEDPAAGDNEARDTPVNAIVPHYACGGSVLQTTGEEANLAQSFIAATDDPTYAPKVDLEAGTDGEEVTASVAIEGGRPPYTVEWHSNFVDLAPGSSDPQEISYDLEAFGKPGLEAGTDIEETLSVQVRDANGVTATAAETLSLGTRDLTSPRARALQPAVGGTLDFGSESVANKGWGKGTNDKFERVLRNDGVTQRFVWDGALGWERDFHAPHDSTWADNADIVYLSGHGFHNGITFVDKNHDDTGLYQGGEAHGDWGDTDLEWLTFGSCNVLEKRFTSSGDDVVQRWGDEFDGLHALLGFHTLMQLWDGLGEEYAQAMIGDAFPLVNLRLTVVQSWFLAIQRSQDWREGVAMGPIRTDGVSNYQDHFHGQGSVGPDIPQSQIENFWVVSESGYQHYDL